MKHLTIVDHPVIRERLTTIRSMITNTAAFRHALHDVSRLMCFEVTRDLETEAIPVSTPLKETEGFRLKRPVILVPILRAGVGMLHGFSEILTEAAVGYIGMYRDEETLKPHRYYCKMPPKIEQAEVILIDPMLASGHSAADAADQIKAEGATRIRFACLIAAPEGVDSFSKRHPDIPVYTASLDERLDEKSYIIPGLGDAGDRYFGT